MEGEDKQGVAFCEMEFSWKQKKLPFKAAFNSVFSKI